MPKILPRQPIASERLPAQYAKPVGFDMGDVPRALTGAGGDIAGVGQDLAVIAEKRKQEDARNRAIEATDRLQLDNIGKADQYSLLNGKDAVDALKSYQKDLDDRIAKAREGMSGIELEMFNSAVPGITRSHYEKLGNHAVTEHQAWDDNITSGRIATANAEIQKNYDAYFDERAKTMARVKAQSPRDIKKQAQVELELKKTWLDTVVAGNPDVADAYLDEHQEHIGRVLYGKYKQKVKTERKQLKAEGEAAKKEEEDAIETAEKELENDAYNHLSDLYQAKNYVEITKFLGDENSGLSGKKRLSEIKILQKAMKTDKDPLAEGDTAYTLDYWDKCRAGEIDPVDINAIPWKLSRTDTSTALRLAKAARDPLQKAIVKSENSAVKYGRGIILKESFFATPTEPQRRDAYSYEQDLMQTLDQGEVDGKSRKDMLTKGHKDFVVDEVLSRYLVGPVERLRQQATQFRNTSENKIPKRKKNETIEAYLKRTKSGR